MNRRDFTKSVLGGAAALSAAPAFAATAASVPKGKAEACIFL